MQYANGVLVNSPPAWDDLRVAASSVKTTGASNVPDFAKLKDNGSGSQGVYVYLFDAGTMEQVFFAVQIPHAWKQGTNLHPHVHWAPVANGSAGQKVSWGLEYAFAEIGGVFGNTNIIYGNECIYDGAPVAYKHCLTPLPEIDMSGVDSVSSMIICRLFRDATGVGGTDDYASDVAFLEFDFHYQIDSDGSDQQFSKSFR
jgi:hypothetical protein